MLMTSSTNPILQTITSDHETRTAKPDPVAVLASLFLVSLGGFSVPHLGKSTSLTTAHLVGATLEK